MLNLMRKHARSWLIKILLAVVALVFIIGFGMGGYGPGQDDRLVEVNGVPITSYQLNDELGRLQEEAKKRFGPQFEAIAKFLNLKQRALSTLVDRVLMTQSAQAMGLAVTNTELAAHIAAIPAFQLRGRFNEQIYRRVLARNRMTPQSFEDSQRTQLLFNKLSTLMIGAVQVTDQQVELALREKLTEIKAVYVVCKPADYAKGLTATPAELAAYYQQHKADYQVPAQVKLAYITFPAADYLTQVNVTEDDIAAIYQIQRKRYIKPEQVAASHILIKLAPDALPQAAEAAKKKAQEIMAQAKAGKVTFAELAKKYSEGPTGPKGGDLGLFGRGQMDPAFEKTAFSLKEGELGLVRTRFGYHVVLVTKKLPARTIPMGEVAGDIRKAIEEERAGRLALAAAERAFELVGKGMNLEAVAKKLGATVSTTGWTVLGAKIPALPGADGIKGALAGMDVGKVARPLSYKMGAFLAAIAAKRPARIKSLKEVEVEVRSKVLAEKAEEKARAAATALLKKCAAAADPAKALAAEPRAVETGWLKRGESVKGLRGSEGLVRALFLRPADKPVIDEAIKVFDGFVAAAVAGRKLPSEQEMAARRDEVAAEVLMQQRQLFLQAFRTDLTAAADIKILGKL